MRFELSAQAFHEFWSLAGLGELPLVLEIRPAGFTERERVAVLDAAHRELAEAGLLRRGRPDADAEGLLRLLHRPRWSADARLWLDGSVRAVSGVRASNGALAVLAGGRVRVREIVDGEVVCSVVDLLPEQRRGSWAPVSLPRELVTGAAAAAGTDPAVFEAELVRARVRPGTAAVFAGLVAGAVRRGQFGVAGHDRRGRRYASDAVLNVVDTAEGRYALWDSGPRLHAEPADRRALSARLCDVLHDIDVG